METPAASRANFQQAITDNQAFCRAASAALGTADELPAHRSQETTPAVEEAVS